MGKLFFLGFYLLYLFVVLLIAGYSCFILVGDILYFLKTVKEPFAPLIGFPKLKKVLEVELNPAG